MGHIYNNIIETVGRTPLVKLNKVTAGVRGHHSAQVRIFQSARQRQGSYRHGDD